MKEQVLGDELSRIADALEQLVLIEKRRDRRG